MTIGYKYSTLTTGNCKATYAH